MDLLGSKKKLISFNINNEQVVLANMLISNKIRRKVSKEVKSKDWLGKKHKVIFNILCRMVERNLEYDIDTFESIAKENEDFGGLSYLTKLESLFDENVNIDYHVELLKSDSVKHHLKEKGLDKLKDLVNDPHSDILEIKTSLDKMRDEVIKSASVKNVLSGIELRKTYWKDLQERMKESIFVPSGIKGLDRWLTEGFARKKTSIWSARPGMGKTTTLANVALNLSRGITNSKEEIISPPKKVLVAPLESGPISYIDIMVTVLIKEKMEKEMDDDSGLPLSMVGMKLDKLVKDSDKINEEELANIKWAMDQIFSNDNLTIIDDPMLSLDELEVILEEGNYDVCIVDLWERLSDIEIDAGKITKKLTRTQAMAKTCNVHMAVVHQQRRADAKSKSKRPTMEALKNSGAYEEVADLIVFLYRPKYYDHELEEDVIELIIAKQRRGAMGKSAFHEFHADYATVGRYRKNYTENQEDDF